MKVKPQCTLKAQIRTFSFDIGLYNDYLECSLYTQANAFGLDLDPLRQLAAVLGLTYVEVWRWHQIDQVHTFADLKPRRVAPLIQVLVDETRLNAEVYIKTVLGKERAFVLYNPDVLSSDLSRIWDLQKVLCCSAEFWHRGSVIKRS